MLADAYANSETIAALLLVSLRRFPCSTGDRTQTIVKALAAWLPPDADHRPVEDWLT